CLLGLLLYRRVWSARYQGAAAAGLLLGLCAMISPWLGLVFAGIITIREFLGGATGREQSRAARLGRTTLRLMVAAAVAALPIALWLAWLEWSHPGIVAGQFLEHLRRSEKTWLTSVPVKFVESLMHSPYQWPALVVTLIFIPRLFLTPGWRKAAPEMFALGF